MIGFQTLNVNQSVNADINNLQFVLKEGPEIMEDIVVTAAMLKTFGNKDEIFLRKEKFSCLFGCKKPALARGCKTAPTRT